MLTMRSQGLSLEQVDKMMEETSPRTSAKWKPHTTFASMQMKEGHRIETEDVERKGSIF